MKIQFKLKLLANLLLASTINHQLSTALAQGTAFTYQGRLTVNGGAANGDFDMRFTLFDNSSGGSQVGNPNVVVSPPVTVNAGLFLAKLDFGPSIFTGASRWLEIAVRPIGSGGAYTVMAPRRELTPTPYAIYAESAGQLNPPVTLSAYVGSTIPFDPGVASVLFVTNSWTGVFAGSAIAASGQTAIAAYGASGNSARVATSKYGVEGAIVVTNGAAVHGVHMPSSTYGELGKSEVVGGGEFRYEAHYGVYGNALVPDYAGYFLGHVVVEGPLSLTGALDAIGSDSTATIGAHNLSSVPGAAGLQGLSDYGWGVSGKGGDIGVFAQNSTVPGHVVYLATKALAADMYGDVYVHGTIQQTSDRNAKENFAPVDPQAILEKVASLPMESWNFRADKDTRHVGPMAQDFYAAFAVGSDDKSISVVDAQGVALSAIQGLNRKVEAENRSLRAAIGSRDTEMQELRQQLAELKRMVTQKSR